MGRILAAVVLGAAFTGLAVADDSEKALKDLEGVYGLKSLTKGGKSAPAEVIAEFKEAIIKGDKITLRIGSEDKVAKIKIDPSKKPAHIDLTPTEGPEKDKTMQGIYRYEKGTLTITMAREGGDRPKDFKSEGDEIATIVFQKKKGD
jgi:uncharacterized protein (TIGR03067 family)